MSLPALHEGRSVCRAESLVVYAERRILGPLDLTLQAGERLLIRGPNGAGKSTLILALLGLLPEDGGLHRAGTVHWDTSRTPAIVLQDPRSQAIMPTVEEELAFVLENAGVPTDSMNRHIDRALARVGLQAFRTRLVHTLSGGELQRLSIACALITSPEVLVLDEPFSQLDGEGANALRLTLDSLLSTDPDLTMILVEHRRGPWDALVTRELTLTADGTVRGQIVPDPGPPGSVPGRTVPGRTGSGRAGSGRAGSVPAMPRPAALPRVSARGLAVGRRRRVAGEGSPLVAGDIDLDLSPGQAVALSGPNGSGKTTLLWTLCGVLAPLEGSLVVGEMDLTRRRGRRRLHGRGFCRIVLQEASANFLRSDLRGELESLRCPPERVTDQLARGGIDGRLDDPPQTLSVGQMRLFSVLAAAGASPPLLLLDEPTAALDPQMTELVVGAVFDALEAGSSLVIATHDEGLLATPGLFAECLRLPPRE